MRLLHKRTLQFEWFLEGARPRYYILSHRWRGEETTMQEFLVHRSLDDHEVSDGVRKTLRFCEKVRDKEHDFIWVDTCCINKESSTELQEAINSMYKWYAEAAQCFVYLDDVAPGLESDKRDSAFANTSWFKRGWTLQELLAPDHVTFLDAGWHDMGDKKQLVGTISQITGIGWGPLLYYKELDLSIAEKMSWMSERKTSRVEDVAYCMLGLFDVNISMLYGEGDKAFYRLQKELIESVEDESIFLWPCTTARSRHSTSCTLLASSPDCFAISRQHNIALYRHFARDQPRVTARGIEVELLASSRELSNYSTWDVPLNVTVDNKVAIIRIEKEDHVWHRKPRGKISFCSRDKLSLPMNREDREGLQFRIAAIRDYEQFLEEPRLIKIFVR